jgi:hypothetical protein
MADFLTENLRVRQSTSMPLPKRTSDDGSGTGVMLPPVMM